MMHRRTFLQSLVAFTAARSALAAAGAASTRIGMCSFSCHQQWKAVTAKHAGVKFTDALSFYRYARELGSEGVQTPLRGTKPKAMRELVEQTGGYYEGEMRLPHSEQGVSEFAKNVAAVREAGAMVARAVFTGARRYEGFHSMEEFRTFHAQAEKSLALAEPVLRKHKLKIAMENHKDHTTDELVALMKQVSSEWVGVLVDTGNNIALLEEPHAVIDALAPFAFSVHLKDMAVQPYADGFLLSEVPLGTGLLDLPRVVKTLAQSNPRIVFNLEMGTRDPLQVPCLTDAFFVTFPERKATHLDAAMQLVKSHPPKSPPPSVTGKEEAIVLAEEEKNNRQCFAWMHAHMGG